MDNTTILIAVKAALSDTQLPSRYRERLRERISEALFDSPSAVAELIRRVELSTDSLAWYQRLSESAGKNWPDQTKWAQVLDAIEQRQRDLGERTSLEKELQVCPPSAAKSPEEPRSKRPIVLSAVQQQVLNELSSMAAVYFDRGWAGFGIQPRIQPLIAAPSGSGKSFLVRTFAEAQGLPMLRLSYAEWLPRGARARQDTATRIHEFLQGHERCVLFVDELDKMQAYPSDWSSSILTEVFLLLDRTLFQVGFSSDAAVDRLVARRLAEGVFMVGGGAWQAVWNDYARPLGFGATQGDAASDIAAARQIPDELLRRFGGTPLILPPATAADLRLLAQADGLEQMAARFGMALNYDAGAASNRGIRWLEDQRLAVEQRRLRSLAVNTTSEPTR